MPLTKTLLMTIFAFCTLITVITAVSAQSIMPLACDGNVVILNGEPLCVYGTGFDAHQEMDIYVINDQDDYLEGQLLKDLTQEVETVQANEKGLLKLWKVWESFIGGFVDIVADLDRNGRYDATDVVNAGERSFAETGPDNETPTNETCEECVEEVPEFSTIAAALVLIAAGVFIYRKRGAKK